MQLLNRTPDADRRNIGRPKPKARIAAFTILESMMATFVMAMAIATSITTIESAILSLDTARNLTLAGQIMVTEVEQERMLDWATVNAYAKDSPTPLTIDSSFTSNPRIGTRFTLTRTVTTVGGNVHLLQLTFTIAWNRYDGRTLSRSYTTYYAHYGIHDYLYNTA